jgi:hypothetical protein
LLPTIQQHLTWVKSEASKRGTSEPEWLLPNEEAK